MWEVETIWEQVNGSEQEENGLDEGGGIWSVRGRQDTAKLGKFESIGKKGCPW